MRLRLQDLPEHMRAQIAPMAKPHKYKARETLVDNIRFKSALEAEHYKQLKLAKAAGIIRTFIRQVSLHLPGGTRHIVDWMILRDGLPPLFAESKGMDLAMGRLKRKQVAEIHGINIVLWKAKKISLTNTGV